MLSRSSFVRFLLVGLVALGCGAVFSFTTETSSASVSGADACCCGSDTLLWCTTVSVFSVSSSSAAAGLAFLRGGLGWYGVSGVRWG